MSEAVATFRQSTYFRKGVSSRFDAQCRYDSSGMKAEIFEAGLGYRQESFVSVVLLTTTVHSSVGGSGLASVIEVAKYPHLIQ